MVLMVVVGCETTGVDKVDVQPDVQVVFSNGNGDLANTEKSVGKIDSLAALVTESLNQNPAHALESSIEISDVCPICFVVDVVGAGMEEYRRNAILCQVEFRDVDGKPLRAIGVSSNERYGDWFYIGVAPGENRFAKTIRPPKGARSLTLKLSRFYNTYGLAVKNFEVVH